jgi:heptosyltransferase-2
MMIRTHKRKEPEKILIIRLSAIGDVLLTTPVIRMMKRRFPESSIDFVVKEEYVPLLRSNSNLNFIWGFDPDKGFAELRRVLREIRAVRYDLVVDFQVNLRSIIVSLFSMGRQKVHVRLKRWKRFLLVHFRIDLYSKVEPVPIRFLQSLKSFEVKDDGKGLDLAVEEDAQRTILQELEKRSLNQKQKIIAIAPGAGRATKRWLEKGFADVSDHFLRIGYCVVLMGGRQDQKVCQRISRHINPAPLNFSGLLSLEESTALLSRSDLLITNDTGLMHMASALGKPVVAIFGPTSRHLGFMPFRTAAVVVERPLSCRPCSYHGTEHCPKDHFKCMKEIRTIDVIRAAEAFAGRG